MRRAIIEDGVVKNIVIADESVGIDAGFLSPGDTLVGGVWVKPAPSPEETKAKAKAELEETDEFMLRIVEEIYEVVSGKKADISKESKDILAARSALRDKLK